VAKGAGARPYFLIAAGAGGSLPLDKAGEPPRSIKTLLATIGDVEGPIPGLHGGAGGGKSNLCGVCPRFAIIDAILTRIIPSLNFSCRKGAGKRPGTSTRQQ
jgi:hypothetical protein